MAAQIIDGTRISAQIKEELKGRIAALKMVGHPPGLAVILVGDDPASVAYVRMKTKAGEDLGMYSKQINMPYTVSEEDLLRNIDYLNADPRINGLLVQLPLPKHIEEKKVAYRIDPEKDVDAFHPMNLGRILMGDPHFLPATPAGIQQLLVRSGNSPEGKHVVVLGRSNIVGKPIAAMLMQKAPGANATVTVCHSGTRDLASITRTADILIAAMGEARFVKADMVKDGVVVIDVGSNRVDDPTSKTGHRMVGDVDYEAVSRKAAAITPVPGGVGPMTIAMLLSNTVTAAERAQSAAAKGVRRP
jgi:methylenetetrahydrofolate dehydrogenase (NADP+)/methenyltetrahydrofolate cyclohydrolase